MQDLTNLAKLRHPPPAILKTQVEEAVLGLPGVRSCLIARLSDANGGTDGRSAPTAAMSRPLAAVTDGHSAGVGGGAATHILTAMRAPLPRFKEPLRPSGSGKASGGSGGRARVNSPDDHVWDALRAAHDATGRRKAAGARDVLEAVRGLGYGARVCGEAEGGAGAMEASQVIIRGSFSWIWRCFF